jgi:hypothetical protein
LSDGKISINLFPVCDSTIGIISDMTLRSWTWCSGQGRLVASQNGCFLRRRYLFATAQQAIVDGFIATTSLDSVRMLVTTARKRRWGGCRGEEMITRIKNTWQQTIMGSTLTSRSNLRRLKRDSEVCSAYCSQTIHTITLSARVLRKKESRSDLLSAIGLEVSDPLYTHLAIAITNNTRPPREMRGVHRDGDKSNVVVTLTTWRLIDMEGKA